MQIWLNSPRPRWSRFVLLDRDGVLNLDRPDFVKTPGEFRFHDESLGALRLLRELRIHPILISNQSGLGRGIIAGSDFWDIHQVMSHTIQEHGGELFAAFYCPHTPDEGCLCRKPSPGLILAAAELFHIDLGKTWFIGDRPTDLEAARRAGCRGLLLERFDGSLPKTLNHSATARSGGDRSGFSTLTEAVQTLFPAS